MEDEEPKLAVTPTEEVVEKVPAEHAKAAQSEVAPELKRDTVSFGIVVSVSVVVALLLITIGFFAYRGVTPQSDSPDSSAQQTDEDESLDRTSPVDEQAVDTELEQIEAEVETLDNSSDFNDSELSDEALGL